MSDLQFANSDFVHLLWPSALLVIFLIRTRLSQSKELSAFISPHLQSRLVTRTRNTSRLWQILFIAIVLLSGTIALMRPQTPGGNEKLVSGRVSADLMIVLDLSKSMLAEDAAPNRLNRAKSEISEMVEHLSGHRVGLVGFAGKASVLCPLTTDYGFFNLTLGNAGPNSITKGGTQIGKAIRTAVTAFGPGQASRLILLVTDGEDHESYPKEAAQNAKDAGIRIVTIGFGSETGSQITMTDSQTGAKSVLKDKSGIPVLSKLDGETLRELALLTEGAYIPAGTAALDLESIVDEHIEPIVTLGTKATTKVQPNEHYLPFVLISLFSLIAAVWVGHRPERVLP
ncbi:MAG: VWA domain-containing protein [Myxococcota bacterium]|nr:VWA domain-containing protein [Myxococcota bacterium]